MEAIIHPLSGTDGVACFTRLYLGVTEGVQAELGALTFADPPFIADLDVRFANLYIDAVEESAKPSSGNVPRAWAPLFESRSRRGIAPLQFAIVGMNAHINRDLPLALVASCRHAGVRPKEGSPEHADYLRVNDVLATVESRIKEQYLSGWLHRLDRVLHRVHRLDDIVAMRGEGADPPPSPQRSSQISTATGSFGGVPIFPNTRTGLLERLAYYEARKLNKLPTSLLDYHDVIHGRETPDERRAREAHASGHSR